MEKIKEIIKKKKIIIGVLSLVIIAGIIVIVSKQSKADPDNTVLKTQVVENLMFENATLEYNNGISTFTVDVYNENDETYTLNNISIKFTVDEKEVTLIGYIGNTLEKEEGRKLTASVDKDIRNATNLEYIINK